MKQFRQTASVTRGRAEISEPIRTLENTEALFLETAGFEVIQLLIDTDDVFLIAESSQRLLLAVNEWNKELLVIFAT